MVFGKDFIFLTSVIDSNVDKSGLPLIMILITYPVERLRVAGVVSFLKREEYIKNLQLLACFLVFRGRLCKNLNVTLQYNISHMYL